MSAHEGHKFRILWKLYHQGCFGKKHIAKRDICKGLPPHEIRNCFDALGDLVKENLVVRKRHKHGDPYRYYLNRERKKEIREFLEQAPSDP